MIKNARSIKDQARNIAKENDISIQQVLQNYMFERVLERKITNSRMKDYYDLYFFVNYRWDSIDKEILSEAIIKTFSARNSITELRNIR